MGDVLWDVFISHASEDKERVARPLAKLLRDAGLRVWIDESELQLGDSLRRKIDEGLAGSRYGVVVLSRSFFAKEWPQRELDALSALSSVSEHVVLPVWHGVDHQSVSQWSPMLADKIAVSTDRGMEQVALAIISVISGSLRDRLKTPSVEAEPMAAEFQDPRSLAGRVINGYQLQEFVGAGGSGIVFRGRHTGTGREVAIKVLYPLRATLSHATQLLERGFRSLSALRHQNIAAVFEFDRAHMAGLETWYLAMEFVRGPQLLQWSEEIDGRSDALNKRLHAAIELTDALHSAHEASYTDQLGFEARGVLHGDLKPANIIVASDGKTKLLDFMLVDIQRLLDPRVVPSEYLHGSTEPRNLTAAFGTPGFMAPEQELHGLVTVKTDIFGLGMTFAHLFAPKSSDPLREATGHDGSFPAGVGNLVREMTSASPALRPDNVRSVSERLREIDTG